MSESQFEWSGEDAEEADSPPEDSEEREELEEEVEKLAEEAFGDLDEQLALASDHADEAEALVDERTVNVPDELDEDAFFNMARGGESVVTRYDHEKAVPMEDKPNLKEIERYWVNQPYAFIVIYRSTTGNELKYYVVEPHLTPIEEEMHEFLVEKLSSSLKYAGEGAVATSGEEVERAMVIEEETKEHIDRYGIRADSERDAGSSGLGDRLPSLPSLDSLSSMFESEEAESSTRSANSIYLDATELPELHGRSVRPEPRLVEEDASTLTTYQIRKLLYFLKRDFIGYQKIDPIKHDINVEDISVDGYDMPVFVYHTEYEQIISNVEHGHETLDEFVIKLAQRSGKGISKRQPQVDCTLPDGSRAQLTLGEEVSDHGTNYTIRQFKDVPFTPVDLVNWHTFSLEEMAFLWLCIENNKSLIFAGGTASGKTTSLNAVSLFIPSTAKIVSIEDTREVELPQRNWVASVTRPSFSEDGAGDVDEFDLLEAALRQRPEYIVFGEVRGEEGRDLFQVMSTGHTTYTTFHADSVGEVMKRFTTDPINVSKTMFTALDLVSIQEQTRVQGHKVRRNQSISAINDYDAENNEINVEDVYVWSAERDEFDATPNPSILERIKFDRGWSDERLNRELFARRVILSYLIQNGLNTYAQVAGSIQAFINDPETILALIANGRFAETLENLRQMESVEINVDPEKEELVPRPEPNEELLAKTADVMDRAEEELFPEYQEDISDDVAEVLVDILPPDVVDESGESASLDLDPSERGIEDAWRTDEGGDAETAEGDD